MLFMQRRIENRKHTCISTFRDIYIYVLRIGDEQISLFHLCVILVHQFVPGFPPATLAQRRRRSAFYLPGDPLSTATRAAQAFLGELTIAIAPGSVGSSAESLFSDHFLSSIEI